MDECRLHPDCLWHYAAKVKPNVVVYFHLLPWYPVIDIFLRLSDGLLVNVFQGKWEIHRDYDFALWWVFEGCYGNDDF